MLSFLINIDTTNSNCLYSASNNDTVAKTHKLFSISLTTMVLQLMQILQAALSSPPPSNNPTNSKMSSETPQNPKSPHTSPVHHHTSLRPPQLPQLPPVQLSPTSTIVLPLLTPHLDLSGAASVTPRSPANISHVTTPRIRSMDEGMAAMEAMAAMVEKE